VDYIDGLMWRALPQVLQDKQARAHWRHKVDVQGEQGGALSEEREALQGRLKDLADDYAKGLLDRAQLLSGTDQIRGRVREIDAELGAIGAASVSGDWWADVEYVIRELDKMASEELRELIRLVCTDVVIHQRGRGRKDLRGDLLTVKAIGGKSYPKTK